MAATFNPMAASTLREAGIDLREFWQNLSDDFTLTASDGAEYRFICSDKIDEIMQDELASDMCLLGCFNSNFLADILNLPEVLISAAQTAGAYEAIGETVIQFNKLEDLQEAYVNADGYGHHFAYYDHEELELTINSEQSFYMFRIN
ncbi:MAG: hypothetical protein IJA20_02690 [Methanocorpusculum sp.]|nr:hypothetical protein [Methanocorpusculum sp.]